MAALTIGGQDYPAALNLRALRLFQEETGRSITDAFTSMSESGNFDAGIVARAVWALANAKLNGPDFDLVESSIEIDQLAPLMEQIGAITSKGNPEAPRVVAEATSQQTGSSSGPSATED